MRALPRVLALSAVIVTSTIAFAEDGDAKMKSFQDGMDRITGTHRCGGSSRSPCNRYWYYWELKVFAVLEAKAGPGRPATFAKPLGSPTTTLLSTGGEIAVPGPWSCDHTGEFEQADYNGWLTEKTTIFCHRDKDIIYFSAECKTDTTANASYNDDTEIAFVSDAGKAFHRVHVTLGCRPFSWLKR